MFLRLVIFRHNRHFSANINLFHHRHLKFKVPKYHLLSIVGCRSFSFGFAWFPQSPSNFCYGHIIFSRSLSDLISFTKRLGVRKYKSFICLERLLFCFLSKISIYGIPFLFCFPFLYRLDSGWEYLPHNYCYGRYMHILKVLTFWSIKWLYLHMLKMFISFLYSVALRKKCVDRPES